MINNLCLCAKWLKCCVPAERYTKDKQTNSPKKVLIARTRYLERLGRQGIEWGIVWKVGTKMWLPDDLLQKWCRDGYFCLHPGEGRRGGGKERKGEGSVQSGELQSETGLEYKQHRGMQGEARGWTVRSPTPPYFGTQILLWTPSPTFPAGIRGIWRSWTNPEECSTSWHLGTPGENVSRPLDWPASWWAISPLNSQIACFFLFLTS